jgi:hypothetical protein
LVLEKSATTIDPTSYPTLAAGDIDEALESGEIMP